ncbi:MAG: DUF5989 family protein [Desulfosudaceae bacterium]
MKNREERESVIFLKDLWGFLNKRKKYWLLPIILVLLFFGVLIVMTSGTAVSPFVYTLF